VWAQDPQTADIQLGQGGLATSTPVGAWTCVLVAPFLTADDGVTTAELTAAWHGQPNGLLAAHPLLVSPDTLRVLSVLWGPAAATVHTAESVALLPEAEQSGAWAIIPFDELRVGWKVLRLDGISPLEKGLRGYPLQVPLFLSSASHSDVLPSLAAQLAALSNRDEARMTIVAMTGTTALARLTAYVMEKAGMTYPARDIGPWLKSADIVHISNEVSFTPDAMLPNDWYTMQFLSNDRYIQLLEAIGANVIELTGNHLNDYGRDPLRHTLDLYRERGWHWYGGGSNLAEATRPLTITQGPNHIAFLGCNPAGPEGDWATDTEPGSAPADYGQLVAQIRALRAQGYLPIVTIQYFEQYQYEPTPQQVALFRALAEAGAVVVQGSQAHQPQAMEIHGDSFIHYGLGNLFFDQMFSLPVRQEFIDRLVFYDGRLASVDLRTALLEDYARPRPMTAEERQAFLQMIFGISPQTILESGSAAGTPVAEGNRGPQERRCP